MRHFFEGINVLSAKINKGIIARYEIVERSSLSPSKNILTLSVKEDVEKFGMYNRKNKNLPMAKKINQKRYNLAVFLNIFNL